jgi:phage shock protein C
MKRLYRSKSDAMIAGICSGLAKYLEVDPTVIRLAFVLLLVLAFGGGFWVYLIMWIIIPIEPTAGTESVKIETKTEAKAPKQVEAPKPAAAKKTSAAKPSVKTEK